MRNVHNCTVHTVCALSSFTVFQLQLLTAPEYHDPGSVTLDMMLMAWHHDLVVGYDRESEVTGSCSLFACLLPAVYV